MTAASLKKLLAEAKDESDWGAHMKALAYLHRPEDWLPALLAERDEFLSVLDDVSECLSHYEDASCEDGERFTPNRAMSMRQVVDDLRAKHAKDPRP